IIEAAKLDDVVWYYITYNNQISGHVRAEYVYVGSELPEGATMPNSPGQTPEPPKVTPTPTPPPSQYPSDDVDFETKLSMEGFPETYKDALRRLHAIHPNWVFEA